jgi:Sec-independent protein secretion pathway component TatC
MENIPWIFIVVGVLLLLALIVTVYMVKKGRKRKVDYYGFFIIGVIWTAIGIPLSNYPLSVMGLVFLILGLANKDKWKEREKWSDISPQEKKLRIILIMITSLLVVAGLVFYYLAASNASLF